VDVASSIPLAVIVERSLSIRILSIQSLAAVTVALVGCSALAQSGSAPRNWQPPRNEFGQPDLQGTWNNATITPMERPASFGERRALTDDEVRRMEQAEKEFEAASNKATDPAHGVQEIPNQCRPGFTGANCGYNSFWVDTGYQVVRIQGESRTSIVFDPPNGRIPGMTPEAQKARAEQAAATRARQSGPVDGPEARSLGERCIMSFGSSAGPPMLPSMYNNNYQIVQNKDYVMILVEMVHDARIIRISGKPLPANMNRWMGDSIGRYEGNTLIVETNNIHPAQSTRGSPQRKVTERFTRVAPNRIEYEFRVDDPSLTQSYAGALNFNATGDALYEYACHEGNYALPGILAGARADERAAAEKASKPQAGNN
jgi:hypothetical protein